MSETKAAKLADRIAGGDPAAPTGAGSGGPVSAPAGNQLLFLREDEIRSAQDMLFFAYRDFTDAADVILAELDLGRAHHRALHFIGRNPGITVSELLGILRITKQSLARVLTALIAQGTVAQVQGRSDRRQRLLSLTPAGQALERRLFERQRECLVAAYRDAGASAVDGFRRVLRGIMNEDARRYVDGAAVQVSERPSAFPPMRTMPAAW